MKKITLLLLLAIFFIGCDMPIDEPAQDNTGTPIVDPVPTPIVDPVVTPIATPVVTPIATPVVTPIATPVVIPTPEPVDPLLLTHNKLKRSAIAENIDTIFDTTQIQTMRIVIDPKDWDSMQSNLAYVIENSTEDSGDNFSIDNPDFFECDVYYNDLVWENVGIRYKGNSSVTAPSSKKPFKLDFDEFEDTYPEILNQRFYGFKQLNLKSNYHDESEMHEVVSADLFREFGLKSAHASFYKLYINSDGSENDTYFGVYTLVEEVDDTVIKTQYDNNDGNLYKPDHAAASFASDTYNEEDYGLKTDIDTTYTDISALYDAINSSTRTTDIEQWKSELEAIFDIDIFLKWLAANTTMANWDVYGVINHNFYLYNNPDTGKFEWIPWDGNEALVTGMRSYDFSSFSWYKNQPSWPLLAYILSVSEYETKLKTYVREFANNYFTESYLNPIYDAYEAIIRDAVISENSSHTFTSETLFDAAVAALKVHTGTRYAKATQYAN